MSDNVSDASQVPDADSSLVGKLKKYLVDTGYPLEIALADSLEARGFSVTPNPVFFDDEEQKNREYDARASRIRPVWPDSVEKIDLDHLVKGHSLNPILCFECKHSSKPWVFFSRPTDSLTHTRYQYSSAIPDLVTFLEDTSTVLKLKDLAGCMWHYRNPVRARSFTEGFKKENQPSQIWAALVQVCKASLHVKGHYKGAAWTGITTFIFPTVVTDAKLFSATLHEGEVELEEVEHVIVEFDYVHRSNPASVEQFLVDVVTESQLETFLEGAESSIEGLRELLRSAFSNGHVTLDQMLEIAKEEKQQEAAGSP